MHDQADKLRKMAHQVKAQIELEIVNNNNKRSHVIVIGSGKGGVGKSTLALNLALSLCQSDKRVLLMDADLGLANLDIMLGLMPQQNIYHMMHNKIEMKNIIMQGPHGLDIIPGGSGINTMANLNDAELRHILLELGKLDYEYDFMVIDTGAGISKNVISFLLAANDIIVITTPEPTALTDAYGLIKSINKYKKTNSIYLLINRVATEGEALEIAEKMRLVCSKYLDLNVKYLGYVVNEPLMLEGIRRQIPFIDLFPRSVAARNISHIARQLVSIYANQTVVPYGYDEKGIKHFFKRMISRAI